MRQHNTLNYDFEDFTEAKYVKQLLQAKAKYKFITYGDVQKNERFILWRHDVDFSMHRAYRLAIMESKNELQSTFFLQLSSEFYNLFEIEIKNLVFKISALGHEIGLHFDPNAYSISSLEELENKLSMEKNIVEDLFELQVSSFSFHNPTEEFLKYDDYEYAGMINAYGKYFKDNTNYCSDSNGYWRYDRLESFLDKGFDKIQVLTHPAWWTEKVLSPRERVSLCINGRSKKQHKYYDKLLSDNNRVNVKG